MEKKIIFFDVDGTLVSDTGGIEHVPESAKRAIALTRAKEIGRASCRERVSSPV